MKVIGMIGYVDKYDFVINFAKTLKVMGKAVLVIDATTDKKMKYIIPSISAMEKQYITQYDKIDFLVGFESMHDIENYMVGEKINISLYDYILIDIDSPSGYENFMARGFDSMLFFMNNTPLSIEKAREIIKTIRVYVPNTEDLKMTQILIRAYISRTAEKYLQSKLNEFDIKWEDTEYEIPDDDQDKIMNIDSQFSGIIDVKKHTKMYIQTIAELASKVMTDVNATEVMKAIKRGKFNG